MLASELVDACLTRYHLTGNVVARTKGAALEQRIAQLHAVGIDVNTIAQTLFLTPLSVERTLAALRGRVST